MSKDHLIEEYRTFKIYYDEGEDIFFSELKDRYELRNEPKRASLKSLKQEIDKYFKLNLEFIPFHTYYGTDSDKKVIKICSVKSDGGLIYEMQDKTDYHYNKGRQHLSASDLWGKEYDGRKKDPKLFIVNEMNATLREEIKKLKLEREKVDKKIDFLKKKFEPLDLSFIKDFIKEK